MIGDAIYATGFYEIGKVWNAAPGTPTLPNDFAAGAVIKSLIGPIYGGVSIGDSDHRKWFFGLGASSSDVFVLVIDCTNAAKETALVGTGNWCDCCVLADHPWCDRVGRSQKAHLQAVALLRIVSGQPVPGIIKKLVTGPVRTQDVNFATGAGVVRGRLYLTDRASGRPGIGRPPWSPSSWHRRAQAGEFCDGDGGLRTAGADSGAAGNQGLSRQSWFSPRDRGVGEVVCWPDSRLRGSVRGSASAEGWRWSLLPTQYTRRDFKFVLAVGSQDEMAHVANYYLTGQEARPDGTIELLKPHEYGHTRA